MGPRRRVLKNSAAEANQFRVRSAIAFLCVLAALAGLGFWYFRLQVWQHADYATRSEANRVKLRPVVPGRGLILDRKGRVLADNVPAYRIEVTPFEAGKSERSLLVQRLIGLGTEKRMPLEDDPLSDEQIGLIRAWIDQGAGWPDGVGSPATEVAKHWAYIAPRPPSLPDLSNSTWPRSPIDVFVLACR